MPDQPEDKRDRIVFLSHKDYVRLKDHHPHVLADTRITVIPYPLVGKWVADEAVRDIDVTSGTILMRDRQSDRYVPAEAALRTLALSQAYTFLEVCQLLGATGLETVEYDATVDHTALDNEFTAGLRTSTGIVRSDGSATANIAVDLRHEVRSEIRSSSRFDGGVPDIEAARAKAAEAADNTRALQTFINMRAHSANGARRISVKVDFFSEAHRQVDVLLEFARGLSVALGDNAAGNLEVRLSNRFRWASEANRHQSFSVEVTFPDTGDVPTDRGR